MADTPQIDVRHEEAGHRGSFFFEQDGKRLAEMTYSRANARLVIIDHTEVSKELAGHGMGRKLLDAAVQWARRTQTKVTVTCAFANAQFNKDPSIRDVLA
jgi:predicted GNAT family acetyltransferase